MCNRNAFGVRNGYFGDDCPARLGNSARHVQS